MHNHIPNQAPTPGLRRAGIIALVLAISVAAAGILYRLNHERELKKEVDAQHVSVQVVKPQYGPSSQTLTLPGNVRAYFDAPIYARVSGYLNIWYTDIGAHVKKGQVLGIIETPELDEQILKARADVATAESGYEIAAITAKRYTNLLASDSVSRQETDEKNAIAKSRLEILNAARANLQGLLAQQAFNKVVAPFDGTVTERNTDIGKLVNHDSNSQPLFRVADTRKLRVFVEVPQNYSYQIKPNMQVQITFPERPGQSFAATVKDTSEAIHETSRTSTVELLLDNQDGQLFPGSYAEVHFDLASTASNFRLPVSTLLFRKEGLQVATVGADNKVALKSITIMKDLGRVVEIGAGIAATDRVIDSPPDSIAQGDLVRVQNTDTPSADKAGAKP
jgi:RND family efflux transporter MFP subunit